MGTKSYSLRDGERLVKAARQAIELQILSPRFKPEMVDRYLEDFHEERGVYVTIEHYPTGVMRGSMGFSSPLPIKHSLVDAAIAAASDDPRFVSVSHMEFEHMVVEVSILSRSIRIKAKKAEEIKREIELGKDGLMIESGYQRAVILPKLPLQNGWGKDELLENLCTAADLPKHCWKNPGVKLQKFSCQVFRESAPGGSVEEVLPDQPH